MKSFLIGALVLTVFCISSCQKSVDPNTTGQVAFTFSGIIDTSILLEAGEDNMMMYTDYIDNGNTDVLLMKGEFRDKTNPNSHFLRFEFYGYDSAQNNDIQQNVFNKTDYFSYSTDSLNQTTGSTILKFYTLYGTGATINWDFGDGTFGSGDTAIHTYPASLNDATVTMNSFYAAASCGDTVSNFINLADPVNGQVQFNISYLSTSLDSFAFSATSGFTNYQWDFGNQTTLQGANPFGGVNYLDSLKKTIELTATKTSSISQWKAVVSPNQLTPCFAAFVYDILNTPVTNYSTRAPFKSCVISYMKNGDLYRSYKTGHSNQSNRKVFELYKTSIFQKNARGQETLKLDGFVNTYLYNVNDNTDSIQMVSNALSIAVAHP